MQAKGRWRYTRYSAHGTKELSDTRYPAKGTKGREICKQQSGRYASSKAKDMQAAKRKLKGPKGEGMQAANRDLRTKGKWRY